MNTPQQRYRQYLESLTPCTLEELGEYVSENVRFRDPFNDVTGVRAMDAVLRHMFSEVGPVKFQVKHQATDGDLCLMTWRFTARLRGCPWSFDGMSQIRFNADGKVVEHIDYWDAASALYARLPIIGSLLSWLRVRLTPTHK
jgi:steroid delta-isomerase